MYSESLETIISYPIFKDTIKSESHHELSPISDIDKEVDHRVIGLSMFASEFGGQ